MFAGRMFDWERYDIILCQVIERENQDALHAALKWPDYYSVAYTSEPFRHMWE